MPAIPKMFFLTATLLCLCTASANASIFGRVADRTEREKIRGGKAMLDDPRNADFPIVGWEPKARWAEQVDLG